MKASRVIALLTMLLAAQAAARAGDDPPVSRPADVSDRQAPLLDGMGSHEHPVTTGSKLAQRYFNQGLALAYGFNHAEAERSFREAARLDPDCAMAWWGAALVLGPNINVPMSPDANAKAYEALQRAIALKEKANERERAYIDALSKRYAAEPPEDRKAQGQKAEADRARRRFERAWARADIELTRTRF